MSDLIELSDGDGLIEISAPNADRYASLKLIDWWDQARLRRARVMVVGAGALGNEVLKNLALLGVGYIFLVDFDTVEAANLSRAVLYRAQDVGKRKVEVAAARLREINPDVRVATFHGDVTQALGQGVYRRVDVVIGCLDNRAARLAVNRACWRHGVAWIDGALEVLMGIARVFVPDQGACYECTMTEADYDLVNVRYRCPMLRPEDLQEAGSPPRPPAPRSWRRGKCRRRSNCCTACPCPPAKAFTSTATRTAPRCSPTANAPIASATLKRAPSSPSCPCAPPI